MVKLLSNNFRRGIIIGIAIIFISGLIVTSMITGNKIEVTPLTVSVDSELKSDFRTIADFKLNKYYNISFSENFKETNVILTSYLDKLDLSKEYETVAYSPLVVVMKDTKELNNLCISVNENGFLISDSKIKNNNSDVIFCDFSKIVEAIISGENWNALGGPADKQITLYCPLLSTREGELFKEFLIRTYNNGSKKSNKEIDDKIEKFFSSTNVIQTDITSKLEIMKDSISDSDIFVGFEYEFLEYCIDIETNTSDENLSFIYPQITILKQIYLQYDLENEQLKEILHKTSNFKSEVGMTPYFLYKSYRDGLNYYEDGIRSSASNYNVQDGINAFEIN